MSLSLTHRAFYPYINNVVLYKFDCCTPDVKYFRGDQPRLRRGVRSAGLLTKNPPDTSLWVGYRLPVSQATRHSSPSKPRERIFR